jgi:adenosine deaminase CECR1
MGSCCSTDKDADSDHKAQAQAFLHSPRRLHKMYQYAARDEPKPVASDWREVINADLTSLDDYNNAREQLQAAERERAFDFQIAAASSEMERRAARLLRKIQEYDRGHTYGKPTDVNGNPTHKRTQGEHFLGNVDLINKTHLMKVAKRMPKGAHLHIHWNSCLPARFLIRQARDIKAMYIRSTLPLTTPENFAATRISFMVMTPYEATHIKGAEDDEKETPLGNVFDPSYVPNRWMPYKQFQELFSFPADFGESLTRTQKAERWLEHKMLISEDEAHGCKQTGHG